MDFHAAILRNMSTRVPASEAWPPPEVQTAEQALMELRQAHLDLRSNIKKTKTFTKRRKKYDEAFAICKAKHCNALQSKGSLWSLHGT